MARLCRKRPRHRQSAHPAHAEILENLKAIQLRNGLPLSDILDSGDFTVEMETGTGKTYVYLRTIPELNKRCGSTKFVIVAPSVAIKEGVYKSLQMTEAHFQALYSGYFLYESGIEASFADPLQKNAAVKVYAKFPGWFRVPTPLGSYNPDWAVLIDADTGE